MRKDMTGRVISVCIHSIVEAIDPKEQVWLLVGKEDYPLANGLDKHFKGIFY